MDDKKLLSLKPDRHHATEQERALARVALCIVSGDTGEEGA